MAQIKVNLLPARQRWYLARQKFWRLVYGISLIGAVSYVVGLALFSGWGLWLKQELATVESRIAAAKTEVGGLKEVETQQLVVKSKLSMLTRMAQKSISWADWLEVILAQLPSEMKVTEMEMGENLATQVSLRSSNPVAISQFLDRLEAADWAGVDQITVESLTRSATGEYAVTVKFLKQVTKEKKS